MHTTCSRPRTALAAALAIALGSIACNDDKVANPPAGGGRSEAVPAKDRPASALSASASASASATRASASASASAAPKPPRRICATELTRPGRALPTMTKATFGAAAASDAVAPEPRLETGGGRWTWVNFFAAWCGPCKEEIPRLRAWEQKLASGLRVRFVSLDDDERQLARFLGEQPASGVRAALWLKSGGTREGFLKGLKLPDSPSLPAHALVDPQGLVRCAFEGAIDEGDFSQVESIVARR